MNTALSLASLFSLLTWGVHSFLGSPTIAQPLVESDLAPEAKWTHYYCWHIVTFTLLSMSVGFAYAAYIPSGLDVAILLTILSSAYALWSVALVLWKRRPFLELPQWVLFAIISITAAFGCATSTAS